jgi:hypothetical protein
MTTRFLAVLNLSLISPFTSGFPTINGSITKDFSNFVDGGSTPVVMNLRH